MNIFKRIYKFFFPDKERKADRAQQQVGGPHPPLSSVGKNESFSDIIRSAKKEFQVKKEKIYKILPNIFSKPRKPVFRRPQARKRNQHILLWDDSFPQRWRHKLIRH